MNILGPDALVFGVDDVAAATRYLTDYGLNPVDASARGGRFEALDGTAIEIRHQDDASLPANFPTANKLRETVYGVADAVTLERVGAELSKDREVKQGSDGVLRTVDDMGFALAFQRTLRRPLRLPGEPVNSPGAPVMRPVNELGANPDAEVKPRTLSHVVYFVPDAVKAEKFYERLGFITTDRFIDVGPFMRPAGTLDHHTLFMIQTPPFLKGCEHFTFHVAGPTELMMAGARFSAKGYQTFWGPGRHLLGSNWFWYFNSPLGCHVEYDADMDLHDNSWVARAKPMGADNSQIFLFTLRDKWAPSGPPPPKGVG
jgi:catechol 2,3-dioxygenase-like lactoylglutathione lyase family enzyme